MDELEVTKKEEAKHKAEALIETAAANARELIDEAREQALELIAKAVVRAKKMLEEEEAVSTQEEVDVIVGAINGARERISGNQEP